MARFLVEKATKLQPLQAGDYPQPLAFIVPDVLDMTNRDATFIMEDKDEQQVVLKSSITGGIQLDGQTIIVMFEQNDTKDLHGVYDWALKTIDVDELITIGYGSIQVNKII
jgi:hypothetical protein